MRSSTAAAPTPLILTMAIAPRPGAVAQAAMQSARYTRGQDSPSSSGAALSLAAPPGAAPASAAESVGTAGVI